MKEKLLFILFQNYGDINIWWNYSIDEKKKLLKIPFIYELNKLGDIYIWNNIFGNLNYHYDDEVFNNIYKNFKMNDKNIDFNLNDINLKNISEKVYNDVKNKYDKHKFIVIGHGLSGLIAKYFSETYLNDCLLCICINSFHYNIDFIDDFKNKMYDDVKYLDNEAEFNKLLHNIKNNDEIDKLFGFIEYKLMNDIFQHYKNKFKIMILFIRNYFSEPKDGYEKMYNIETNNEINFLKKYNPDKFDYLLCDNSSFYLWRDDVYLNSIIDKIKICIENIISKKIKRTKKIIKSNKKHKKLK